MGVVSLVERALLELINRARLDPGYTAWRYNIDLNEGLAPGTISATEKQPLAMSDILADTAEFHGNWVLQNDSFSTTGELGSSAGDRMAYAGFNGGDEFYWSEVLGWREYALNTQLMGELSVAVQIWRELFIVPETRAFLMAEEINEVGISLVRGQIADLNLQAVLLTQDFAGTDIVFITGIAYKDVFFEDADSEAFIPQSYTGVEVSGASGMTTTSDVGMYRLAVESGVQEIQFGTARISMRVEDENIKLDRVGLWTVRSNHSFTLLSGATTAELIGTSDASVTAGRDAGPMLLLGNKGNNRLVGNSAENTLDGRAGNDLMSGGGGDDRYYVDSSQDRVVERQGAGRDEVFTTVSFKLAATSEVEVLRGTEGVSFWSDIDFRGNKFTQSIQGTAGNNVLDSGGGGDNMLGGMGDDVYIIRDSADRIFEGQSPSEGFDRVKTAVSFVMGDNGIEYVQTLDASGTTSISLTGNNLDQTLVGNAGKNVLRGLGGNDSLVGGAGDDVLSGGTGTDVLRGGAGSDRFSFSSAKDSPFGDRFDSILDWDDSDRIDLSPFDADPTVSGRQALTFVGQITSTTPLGLGEVGYYRSGGSMMVVANTDIDGDAEFQLRVAGVHTLTADDFILV